MGFCSTNRPPFKNVFWDDEMWSPFIQYITRSLIPGWFLWYSIYFPSFQLIHNYFIILYSLKMKIYGFSLTDMKDITATWITQQHGYTNDEYTSIKVICDHVCRCSSVYLSSIFSLFPKPVQHASNFRFAELRISIFDKFLIALIPITWSLLLYLNIVEVWKFTLIWF